MPVWDRKKLFVLPQPGKPLEKFPLQKAQWQHLFDKPKEFNSVTQNQEQLLKKVVILMKNHRKEESSNQSMKLLYAKRRQIPASELRSLSLNLNLCKWI